MTDHDVPFLDFDLRISHGDFTLDASGEFSNGITAVFGPSGAGKSTLLACLAGMVTRRWLRQDGRRDDIFVNPAIRDVRHNRFARRLCSRTECCFLTRP